MELSTKGCDSPGSPFSEGARLLLPLHCRFKNQRGTSPCLRFPICPAGDAAACWSPVPPPLEPSDVKAGGPCLHRWQMETEVQGDTTWQASEGHTCASNSEVQHLVVLGPQRGQSGHKGQSRSGSLNALLQFSECLSIALPRWKQPRRPEHGACLARLKSTSAAALPPQRPPAAELPAGSLKITYAICSLFLCLPGPKQASNVLPVCLPGI